MNKDQLSQELKQKLKLGIKPSDLKKPRPKPSPNISQDKNNIPTYSDSGILTPPLTPPLKPRQENIPIPPIVPEVKERDQSPTPQPSQSSVKQLHQAVKFWSTTAQNHLLNLSKTSAELFKAEEKIKELKKQKPEQLNQAAEQALIEANHKIRELRKTNQELQEKNTQLSKNLASQNNHQPKATKSQSTQTPHEHKEKQYLFTCDICEQNKKSQLHLSRVNGLGINPTKQNKICAACFKKVDLIPEPQEEFF